MVDYFRVSFKWLKQSFKLLTSLIVNRFCNLKHFLMFFNKIYLSKAELRRLSISKMPGCRGISADWQYMDSHNYVICSLLYELLPKRKSFWALNETFFAYKSWQSERKAIPTVWTRRTSYLYRLEQALDLSKNVTEPAKNDLGNNPLNSRTKWKLLKFSVAFSGINFNYIGIN